MLILFFLFPFTAFAAGDINTTIDLLSRPKAVDTSCVTAEFNNALIENAYMVSEDDDRDTIRNWIYDILQSPEVLGSVMTCPEIIDSEETATLFMPIKYTFPGGREITINYETQPKVLEQRLLLATKTELPSDNPNPEVSPTDPHATWVNTDPAWYGIMVTQSGALRNFVGPGKNNTVSAKWIVDNISSLYPKNMDGYCSTKTGMMAKVDGSMVNMVIHDHTANMEKDKNNYYVAGDKNLKWISVAEVAVDVVLSIVSYGGYAAASGAFKGLRATRTASKLRGTLKTLTKLPAVQKYIRHSLQIAKYTKEIDNVNDVAKSVRNIEKLEKALANTAKGSKKYEKLFKQLEQAKKLKSQNMWKLGKAGQGIDKTSDLKKLDDIVLQNKKNIATLEKEMAQMAKTDKNVAEYTREFNALKEVLQYSKELKAFKTARTGNIITRTWKGAKNVFKSVTTARKGAKTLDRTSRIARQASKSGRVRDWLFHSTMRNAGRITRLGSDIAALSFVVKLVGGFYDYTATESGEFTNGISIKPYLLLSADDIEEYDDVVNYGVWLMWSGDSTSVADDDTAYLQAMDFAQKFYQDLTQVQEETGRYACDVDIYVVRPIIRNPGTEYEEIYWLIMNDTPWTTSNAD